MINIFYYYYFMWKNVFEYSMSVLVIVIGRVVICYLKIILNVNSY